MCPVRYDYERGRGNGPGTSRTRAVIIFVIALAVIGCGIYYFILPHDPPTPETPVAATPSSPQDSPSSTSSTGDDKSAASGGNAGTAAPKGDVQSNTATGENAAESSGKTAPSSAADTQTQTAWGNNTERTPTSERPAGTAGKSADTGNIGDTVPEKVTDLSGSGGTAAVPSTDTPTADPQKGKPWIGDPPSERPSSADKSDKPVEKKAEARPDPVNLVESSIVVAVCAGDSLSRLAHKHHTTVEALRHYNKLDKDVIRIGQKLRVIPGPWRIAVNKGLRELTLERLRGDTWSEFAKFPVGLGRLNSTPDAQFVISTRLRHPDWYTSDGRIYRYGDPENQLGDYFLKLAMTGDPEKPLLGYGIHGTADENSVGKNWSNGCVRMRNRDVEILYYLVPSGTPVKIVPGDDASRKTEI